MRARHRAPRRSFRRVGADGSYRMGLAALGLTGAAIVTVAAVLVSGEAGANETEAKTENPGLSQSPAEGRPGVPQPVARPATTWYSDWSSWGSSGRNCDPMALRWCP